DTQVTVRTRDLHRARMKFVREGDWLNRLVALIVPRGAPRHHEGHQAYDEGRRERDSRHPLPHGAVMLPQGVEHRRDPHGESMGHRWLRGARVAILKTARRPGSLMEGERQ